ncbi:MAG: YkgJ family cysteine cluster protein, partial [Methyloversatilis sp.]|nr:YkgJ family cysteine cluster protein [Methyloversatilis sp.]
MAHHDDNLRFFRARHAAFAQILDTRNDDEALLAHLLAEAFDGFEQALQARLDAGAPVACDRGCATCCTLRVTATAPEVLLIARHLVAADPAVCRRVVQRIAEADERTRFESDAQRVTLQSPCPFVDDEGACVIYSARPLACRG